MEVLGRHVDERVDAWYDRVNGQVIEAQRKLKLTGGRKGSFGATGENGTQFVVLLADDLPDAALAHTLAHELAHVQQILEAYPATQRPVSVPDTSLEAEVGGWIHELVLGPDAERRIAHLGLDRSWEEEVRSRNIRKRISAAEDGKPLVASVSIVLSSMR